MQPAVDRATKILGSQFTYSPEWDRTKNAELTPMRDDVIGAAMRPALFATLAAMAVILLIACANVAALMLGQVESRFSELALRSALGADRGRICRSCRRGRSCLASSPDSWDVCFAGAGFTLLARRAAARAVERPPDARLDVVRCGDARRHRVAVAVALLPAYSVWRSDLRTHSPARGPAESCNVAADCRCSSSSAKSRRRCSSRAARAAHAKRHEALFHQGGHRDERHRDR